MPVNVTVCIDTFVCTVPKHILRIRLVNFQLRALRKKISPMHWYNLIYIVYHSRKSNISFFLFRLYLIIKTSTVNLKNVIRNKADISIVLGVILKPALKSF